MRRPLATIAAAVATTATVATALAGPVAARPGPSFSPGPHAPTYVEQAPPVLLLHGATVHGGTYDGEAIEIAPARPTGTEQIGLVQASAPVTTAGVVSAVGSRVYLGEGGTAVQIGVVDEEADGAAGSPLRIRFVAEFANASFETGDLTGWTALDHQIDLGATVIAGHASIDTSDYADNTNSGGDDDDVPQSADFASRVQGTEVSSGSYALELSSAMTTLNGFDVVHGPAVHSSEFTASAGDVISFDWRARNGDDDFDAFAYVVDTHSGAQIEAVDANGASTTEWTTAEATIPAGGTYRFVFVNGTWDASGGRAAGGTLYVDDVRVVSNRVDAAVASDVLGLVTFADSSDRPAARRTIDVTATTRSGDTVTGSVTLGVTPVEDEMRLAPLAPISYRIGSGHSPTPVTGAIVADDPDGGPYSFALQGATVDADGQLVVRSALGTMRLHPHTGTYRFEPDAASLAARSGPATVRFDVTVNSPSSTRRTQLVVAATHRDGGSAPVPDMAPPAPRALQATKAPGDSIVLSWNPPAGPTGRMATYEVTTSTDGTTWRPVTVAPGATSVTVDGSTRGVIHRFRVVTVADGRRSEPASTQIRLGGSIGMVGGGGVSGDDDSDGGAAPSAHPTTRRPGGGTWSVTPDGAVTPGGGAPQHGSLVEVELRAPAVGIAATPTGGGYWVVGADGGVFAFGDAPFHGSTGALDLRQPVVGLAPTCDGVDGYWLAAADGGVFAFGDAPFLGSMGGVALNQPVVAMAPTCDGAGYWLVGADGGVFNFGSAAFHGSLGSVRLDVAVVGILPTEDGDGYWLIDAEGTRHAFGAARTG